MTDEADLTPEREAAVRRLLGAVGSEATPALPPEVAERLDTALAELGADRRPADRSDLAPVVHLSSRRRKVFAGLFVAAAAVVVAGIGVPLAHDSHDSQQTASSGTALSRTPTPGAPAAVAPQRSTLNEGRNLDDQAGAKKRPRNQTYNTAMGAAPLGGLRDRHLRADVIRLRHRIPADATYASTTVHAGSGFVCDPGRFGRGYLLGVRYAGAPAVIAFRAPVGSTQVAEVLQCGTATVLRSVTLPTP